MTTDCPRLAVTLLAETYAPSQAAGAFRIPTPREAAMDNQTCGLWIMDDATLRCALTKAAAGEDIDVVMLELYANSDVEEVG